LPCDAADARAAPRGCRFDLVREVTVENMNLYALQIKIPDVSVKKSLMSDVNPQSRVHLRISLQSGGTNKQSSFKPVMTELQFNLDTFLPKLVDRYDVLKIELCEKPDTGPSKNIAYYKAPMPKFIDYPVKLQTVPLFGSSGFFQDQPVGKMTFCFRVLSPAAFEDWKLSIENYDASAGKKGQLDGAKRQALDKAGIVADRVLERVVEYALTQMLDYMTAYKNFKRLEVAHCIKLTDYPVIEMVRSFPYLEHLDVSGVSQLTDTALTYIGKLALKLKYLNISGCVGISDDGVAAVASGCLHLEHILFNECTALSDAAIAFIVNFDTIGRLRTISYKGVYRTTDESLTQISGQCTSLESLAVAGSAQASPAAPALPREYVNLQPSHASSRAPAQHEARIILTSELPVAARTAPLTRAARAGQYRDLQLLQLAKNCPQLTSLDIGWCERVSDQGIAGLVEGCTKLTELNLSYCEAVTSKGVVEIARRCPAIHSLDLTGLSRIEDDCVEEVLKSMLNLSWLSLSLCELLSKQTLHIIMDWGEGLTTLEILGCSFAKKDVSRFKQRLLGRTDVVDESDDADGLV